MMGWVRGQQNEAAKNFCNIGKNKYEVIELDRTIKKMSENEVFLNCRNNTPGGRNQIFCKRASWR
jgi:hypothetical protein